jgi:hypothetical protein
VIFKPKPFLLTECIDVIKTMLDIMEKIKVFKFKEEKYVEMNTYFPWRRGIIFTCKSILELQNHLLLDKDYKCVFLGHFTQDGVENLFSQLRSKLINPTPSQAMNCLKKIMIGRYMEEVPTSSYFPHDTFLMTLFLRKSVTIFKILF